MPPLTKLPVAKAVEVDPPKVITPKEQADNFHVALFAMNRNAVSQGHTLLDVLSFAAKAAFGIEIVPTLDDLEQAAIDLGLVPDLAKDTGEVHADPNTVAGGASQKVVPGPAVAERPAAVVDNMKTGTQADLTQEQF